MDAIGYSLSNDIQPSLLLHCALTAHMPDNDPHKFSFATPSTIVSGIKCIIGNNGGNVPSYLRLFKTATRLYVYLVLYTSIRGMVPGLVNRNGHRNLAEQRNTAGWEECV